MIGLYRQGIIEELIAREGGRCRYCKVEVRRNWLEDNRFDDDATIDHIIPKAKGGPNHISNYALACRRCNHAKGDRTVEEFLADPRSPKQRARKPLKKRNVRSVPVPASTTRGEHLVRIAKPRLTAEQTVAFLRESGERAKRGDKPIRGTLAWAIEQGEVTEHHTYKRPPPSTAPGADPRPRGRKMSALEFARWLRESAEKKGQVWPLA